MHVSTAESESGTCWCHNCGGEFRAGTTSVCFDCGGALSMVPPPDDEAGEDVGESTEEVEYDLSSWSESSLRALTEVLDVRDLSYVLDDATLIVRADDEAATDEIVEDIQRVWTADVEGTETLTLPPNIPTTEYDLTEWTQSRRIEVQQRLRVAVVPFELDDAGTLRTPTADEQLVEHVLDAVEFPDALLKVGDDEPVERSDLPPAMQVLSDLYVAADRLKRSGRDSGAISAATAGVEDLVELPMPYGYETAEWKRLVDEADVLWELLVDGGSLHDIEESAQRLRDLLHPLV